MPTPRRCSGCGAALGQPTDDDLTIVCTFCGLRHDINDLGSAAGAPAVVVVGPPPPARLRAMMFAILAVVTLATAAALYVAYSSARLATTLVGDVTTNLRTRTVDPQRPTAVALADLGALTDFAWKIVDTPPPPGGFAAFEPVAALPWAMMIGHAWATDAVLTRIDVGRVSSTGVVDLGGERTSGYRFSSPDRAARWKQETDAGSRSVTKTSLMLEIRGETVRVIVDDSDRETRTTPPPKSLPLPEILARAARSSRFGQRPFYGGYMIHLPREGWVWYLSPPSGDSLPRVRASDGRVFPY